MEKLYDIHVWHKNEATHRWLYKPVGQMVAKSKAEAIAKSRVMKETLDLDRNDNPDRLRAVVKMYFRH